MPFENQTHMLSFQMVVQLPFEIRTPLDHSGTRQVGFSDGHCGLQLLMQGPLNQDSTDKNEYVHVKSY